MQEVGSRKGGRWVEWGTVTSGFGDIDICCQAGTFTAVLAARQ